MLALRMGDVNSGRHTKGPDMGRRLATLIGITTAILAFGLTSAAETGHAQSHHAERHSLAEGKGPTSAGA